MTHERANDWLSQAENDLAFARHGVKARFYSQACFIAQQAAEKAMKSFAFRKGAKTIKTHSLIAMCKALRINGAPHDAFDKKEAEAAVAFAEKFLETARRAK